MFLAVRELWHSRLRYLMIAAVITLVAWLVFLLSGLANGLATDNGAALDRMPADGLVFQSNVRFYLHRSLLPMADVQAVRDVPGVADATPVGHLTITTTPVGKTDKIDATVLAIDPASFIAPSVTAGAMFQPSDPNQVVVDTTFKRYGVALGDTLLVDPSGERLTVVGFTTNQTYNHLPVVFMSIPRWQGLKYAAPGSSGSVTDPISAIAVRGDDGIGGRIDAQTPGVEFASMQTAIENLPGYSAEMGTVTTILVFLFVIAALVLAAFFYVITLQKTNQFGVLKALGSRMSYLAWDLVSQVVMLSVVGVLLGAALTYLVARMIPADVPFALSNRLVVIYGFVLLLVSLLGTILSLVRIARIDALIAIGRVD